MKIHAIRNWINKLSSNPNSPIPNRTYLTKALKGVSDKRDIEELKEKAKTLTKIKQEETKAFKTNLIIKKIENIRKNVGNDIA